MISKIRKRNGRIVDFEPEKISQAIWKAVQSVGGTDKERTQFLTNFVTKLLEERYKEQPPTVENIQDAVEKTLIENGHAKTAKSFILYRQKRNDIREAKKMMGIEDDTKFSLNSLKVLEGRYLQKDKNGKILETPRQLFQRVAKNVAQVDYRYGRDAQKSEQEFLELMLSRDFMPNSPTLMNAGTKMQQLSACFVLPVEDSIEGIFDSVKSAAIIHQGGGGTGFAFSRLRPKGDPVRTAGGVASGPISFMKVFNSATEQIKQGGKRRGANMGILRVDHPDILDFITCKERDDTINNFNISVGITDGFMKAVKENTTYNLINPKNKETYNKLNAKRVFDLICTMAWKNGDPGIVFLDTINKTHALPEEIESTNPCVTGDTLIYTQEGIKRADTLCETYQGLIIDERLSKEKILNSTPIFKTGKRTVYKLKTKEGHELDLTSNHKIRTNEGWIEVKDLKQNDKVWILNRKGGFGKKGDYQLGMCLGWLVGDGTISKNRAILRFYGEEKTELAPKFLEAISNITNGLQKINREYKIGIINLKNKSEIKSARFRRIIEEMGLVKNKFQVPGKVYEGSEDMQKGFLQALFTADSSIQGTLKKGISVRLAQSNLSLLKDVQRLLLNFGITSKVYEERRPKHRKNMPDGKGGSKEYECKAQHELIISKKNIKTFTEEIGFLLKRKNERLTNSVNGFTQGPYSEHFTATFKALEKIGEKDVYDLQEPETHSFIANGFVVHNCGEVPLLPYESCNLGSINLANHVQSNKIDWEKLKHTVHTAVHFLDNVVDASKFPIDKITDMVQANRKIGLGVMGFADMLIKLKLPYNSEEALQLAEKVMKFIDDEAKAASVELAKDRGVFPNFEKSIYDDGNPENKVRNTTRTTIAPTGSISIIANCSSGIEPLFAISYVRKTPQFELLEVNPLFEEIARQEEFYTEELMKKIAKQGSIQDVEEIPESIRKVFVTSMDLTAEDHVRMQAAFQKHTDNAVSKTVNFPFSATVEDVSKTFLLAYESNCKGITIYRDGSRDLQVLNIAQEKKAKKIETQESAEEDEKVTVDAEYAGGCDTCDV